MKNNFYSLPLGRNRTLTLCEKVGPARNLATLLTNLMLLSLVANMSMVLLMYRSYEFITIHTVTDWTHNNSVCESSGEIPWLSTDANGVDGFTAWEHSGWNESANESCERVRFEKSGTTSRKLWTTGKRLCSAFSYFHCLTNIIYRWTEWRRFHCINVWSCSINIRWSNAIWTNCWNRSKIRTTRRHFENTWVCSAQKISV